MSRFPRLRSFLDSSPPGAAATIRSTRRRRRAHQTGVHGRVSALNEVPRWRGNAELGGGGVATVRST